MFLQICFNLLDVLHGSSLNSPHIYFIKSCKIATMCSTLRRNHRLAVCSLSHINAWNQETSPVSDGVLSFPTFDCISSNDDVKKRNNRRLIGPVYSSKSSWSFVVSLSPPSLPFCLHVGEWVSLCSSSSATDCASLMWSTDRQTNITTGATCHQSVQQPELHDNNVSTTFYKISLRWLGSIWEKQ